MSQITEVNAPVEFKMMELTDLFPSPTNPRKHFNEEKLKDLSESIKVSGVIEPIIIRHAPEMEGLMTDEEGRYITGKYEVVAGERRYRASKLAEQKTIPAILRELTDEQVIEIQATENLQREDVNAADQAESFEMWINLKMHQNQELTRAKAEEDLAIMIGKSRQWIVKMLSLLNLIEYFRNLFAQDNMSLQEALMISRLTEKNQKACLEYVKDRRSVSAQDLEYFIQRSIMMDLSRVPFSVSDPDLVPAAGTCVACPKRTGANTLLFPDIKDKDVCTDRVCFTAKLVAFVDKKVEEFTAAGEEFVLICNKWNDHDVKIQKYIQKGFLKQDDYKQIHGKNECEHVIKGIAVDEDHVGQIIKLCRTKTCKVHFGTRSSSSTRGRSLPVDPKLKYDQKIKRGRELDIEKVYARISETIKDDKWIKTCKGKMTKVEEALMWYAFINNVHDYHIADVFGQLGFGDLYKISDKFKNPEQLLEFYRSLTVEDKAAIVRACIYSKYHSVQSNYNSEEAMVRYLFAKEHGVDVALFEKEQAEITAKREQRAKAMLASETSSKASTKKVKKPKAKR